MTAASELRNAPVDLPVAGLTDDVDRVRRPQEGAYEIGAFEFLAE